MLMRSIAMITGLFLLVATRDLLACPGFLGKDPRADLKAALDYYPTIIASQQIAVANCALGHYKVSRRFEDAFKTEKSTVNYRYGRFLSEVADLQGQAANRVKQTGGGTGISYFKRDIEIRTTLVGWCLKDASACTLSRELGALANAYESARQATGLHDWMISNSPQSLAVSAALDIWLRAIASCPAWDFRPPIKEEDKLYEWKEAACSPACREIASDADRVLQEHGMQVSSLKPQVKALKRAILACKTSPD